MPGSYGSRSDRTARLVRIWSLLARNPRGLTAQEIARHCEMSVRTVYRDLAALELEVKVPIFRDGGRHLVDHSALPPVRFSLDEAMALYISARLVSRYADEHDPAVASAFRKLADVLPSPIGERVLDTARALGDRPPNETFLRVLGTLTKAWASRRSVQIGYLWTKADGSAQKVYTRLLDPYFIEPSGMGHSCYVIGYDHYSKEIRTFKIERIREISETLDVYEMPTGWQASDYLKSSWGIFHDDEVEVRVRFSRAVAGRLKEAVWHPSQRIDDEADGTVLYTARVAGTVEITPWILSWGSEAEVLGPPALRAHFQEIAQCWAATYLAAQPDAGRVSENVLPN